MLRYAKSRYNMLSISTKTPQGSLVEVPSYEDGKGGMSTSPYRAKKKWTTYAIP